VGGSIYMRDVPHQRMIAWSRGRVVPLPLMGVRAVSRVLVPPATFKSIVPVGCFFLSLQRTVSKPLRGTISAWPEAIRSPTANQPNRLTGAYRVKRFQPAHSISQVNFIVWLITPEW
jgi:hypothetical protein